MVRFDHSSGQHLVIGDARIYVETCGNPAGPPLVLLHGGLGSLADFNTILDRLPPQFRFIGIDFRGHGKSTLGSMPLTYQQHQRDVERVLEHLGVDTCALLGFSDGGIVGYRMAAQIPTRATSLITVGAQWRLEVGSPAFEMLSGLTAEMWLEMFPESVAYYNAINPVPDLKALVEAVVALWTDQTPTGYPNDEIAHITAPCLIVRGDGDPLLSLNEAAELREKLAGANFFNLPFAGHEVHKDSPELFLAVVNDFLRQPHKLPRDA